MIYQGPKGPDYQGLRAWVVSSVGSRLDVLAQVLEGKEYVLGRFSAADVLLTTVLRILQKAVGKGYILPDSTCNSYMLACTRG